MTTPVTSPIISNVDSDPSFIPTEISTSVLSSSNPAANSGSGSGRSDQSPQRKRARYESDHEREQFETDLIDEKMEKMLRDTVRDETYYLADGSCVLLVEDTLFNVHRTILSKDSSSFSGMFTLPQGHNLAEGTSDAHPIVLTGDTPSEFRNFLWALYALPHELMTAYTPRADLDKLIDIARIANKYSFKSLETWSLDAIQEYVNRKPSPLLASVQTSSYTYNPSSVTSVSSVGTSTIGSSLKFKSKEAHDTTERLTQLIHLAQLCSHDRLLTTMISLLRQLMSLNIQYAYLAMTLADELDLRALRGAAYLEVMSNSILVPRSGQLLALGGSAKGRKNNGEDGEDDQSGVVENAGEMLLEDEEDEGTLHLTPSQRLRLLSGYYRLTVAWEHLRTHPPPFDHTPSCGATWHQHGCTQSWVEFWKEKTKGDAVVSLGMADVLGRLRAVQKEFDRWGSASYMQHDCRMSARRGLAECVRRLEDSLPGYFE